MFCVTVYTVLNIIEREALSIDPGIECPELDSLIFLTLVEPPSFS
jgi:hypothetical protein